MKDFLLKNNEIEEVFNSRDLEYDSPLKKSCGTCTQCVTSCPTGAIVGPYVLDNTKCISFQTTN